jgi:hypothetical protein
MPVEVHVVEDDLSHRLVGVGQVAAELISGIDPDPLVHKGKRNWRVVAMMNIETREIHGGR